ncbi:MAG: LysM peptidoglycan-binding domain-containing protein [Planctomycetota bacterium]
MKIGLVLGLVLVSAAALWLATRPSLSPRARMQNARNVGFPQEPADRGGDLNEASAGILTDDIGANGEIERNNPIDSTIHRQTEKIKTQKFHIVRKGQTLSGISYEYYGSAGKWKKIYEANRKTIKDANVLIPGTKLIIPD